MIGPFFGKSRMPPFPMLFLCFFIIQYFTICSAKDEKVNISKLIDKAGNAKLEEMKRRPLAKMGTTESTVPMGIDLRQLPFKMPKGIEPKNVRRCQFNNGTLWASATECEDELEPESCVNIFGKGEPRPPICLNSELADLAKRCAKTCRLCCERPKFNCVDSGSNLMDCRAHQEKCKEPAWRKIMMAVCEHTCGFCSAEKCFDSAPDCPSLRSLCFDRPISPLFRQQCPQTCGLCQPGEEKEEMTQKAPKEVIVLVRKKNGQKCEDLSPSCGENAKLCNDENYSQLLEEKCAKTCGHCPKEEEEIVDSIKRIRHGKRRIMERPRAANVRQKRKRERPIIVIDNRKMMMRRKGRKERMEMRQRGGGEMVQISREVQADQGENGKMSPIIVMFGGNGVLVERKEEEEIEEEINGGNGTMRMEKGKKMVEKGRNGMELGEGEKEGEKIISKRILDIFGGMGTRRRKRNAKREEEMVDEILGMEEENGEEGVAKSQKEPEIEEEEEEEGEEKEKDEEQMEEEEGEEKEKDEEQMEEEEGEEKEKDEEQMEEEEGEEEGVEEEREAGGFEGILEILKEKIENEEEEEELKEDEENSGIIEEENEEDLDEEEEEDDGEKEGGEGRLENEEKLEEELAMAEIEPGIKGNEGKGQMGEGRRRNPKIIRVRIRPSERRRRRKKMKGKSAEELEKFDGILRDKRGKALRIEEMKGGIGGAMEEIRERYGLGGKEPNEEEGMGEALLETGREMKAEMLAILKELEKISTNHVEMMKKHKMEEGNKNGRRKRKNGEKEEEEEERGENEGKRVLKMLGQLLGMAKEEGQKKPMEKGEEGEMERLVEMLRKRMVENGEEKGRKTKAKKRQELALIEGANPLRLVQFVRMPTNQKLATIPSQIVVGNRLLNGPILVNGDMAQPKQQQMIIAAPMPPQPSILVQPQQPLPQQPPPAAVFQPQISPPQQQIVSPSQQQIVQQPLPQPPPQSPPINIFPSAVQSPQPPLPQPRPPPQFIIQRPISSQREVVLVQPARPHRPFSLLRNPIGLRQNGGALCRDYYPYCEQIVPHGFCNSEFYPLRMKREFCPQSCNLC